MEKMNRKIGIYVPSLNDEQRASIDRTAAQAGMETVYFEDAPGADEVKGFEVLFGQIPVDVIRYAEGLKWLHCAFAGVDPYVDPALYPSDDVMLSCSSGAYGVAISEHIMMVLLMMLKRMPEYEPMLRANHWEKLSPISGVMGSRIAVVGTGDIGSCFGTRAKAMGASIVGVRTKAVKPDWCDEIYTTADIKEAVKDCDIVVSAIPFTPQTADLYDREFFAAMKEGSYFVNVGRGKSVVEDDLCEALTSGHLAGAALDVFRTEPLPPDHPLWSQKNLLITPHCAGDMAMAYTRQRVTDIFIENLEAYGKGEQIPNFVDREKGYKK